MILNDLLLEVAPGQLKAVGECSLDETVAAAFTLMLSDEPDDATWLAEALLVEMALEDKLRPYAPLRNDEEAVVLFTGGLAALPERLWSDVVRRLAPAIREVRRHADVE